MEEIWKDIPGYEGLYQASNLGRIRSLDRIKKGNHNSNIPIRGVVLKQHEHNDGYVFNQLSKNNKQKGFLVSRLVAITFIPNPENKPTVNHKDGIKTNNSVENLEWATQSENNIHAYKTGLWNPARGYLNGNSKPVSQFSLFGEFISDYETAREASFKTGVFWGSISDVCRKKAKTAGGYLWKYKTTE